MFRTNKGPQPSLRSGHLAVKYWTPVPRNSERSVCTALHHPAGSPRATPDIRLVLFGSGCAARQQAAVVACPKARPGGRGQPALWGAIPPLARQVVVPVASGRGTCVAACQTRYLTQLCRARSTAPSSAVLRTQGLMRRPQWRWLQRRRGGCVYPDSQAATAHEFEFRYPTSRGAGTRSDLQPAQRIALQLAECRSPTCPSAHECRLPYPPVHP